MILNINNIQIKKIEPVVERTDPWKGEFSPSSLSSAQCFRKFYLSKLVKLNTNLTSSALVFGSAIHKGVETFYQYLHYENIFFADIKREAITAFVEEWKAGNILGDEKRNLEVGVLLMSQYCDRYREEDTEFETCDIEGAQWMPMPNGTMLLAKLDRIARLRGHHVVIDTKTTSSYLNSMFFNQFKNHLPTTLYYYIMEQALGSCDYILIDAIHTPMLSARSTAEQFSRQTFLRTEEQVEEALLTYTKVTNYLMEGMQKEGKKRREHFYCDQNRCADYGACPYLGVCQHGAGHPSVGTTFQFATPEGEEMYKKDFNL